jgi:hypothetical protein
MPGHNQAQIRRRLHRFRGQIFQRGKLLRRRGRAGLSYLCEAAQSHNTTRIPKRPVNPASSQILGIFNPQAAAARPTIRARTTGTRGLFTPVLVPAVSTWEECSSTDDLSGMNFFLLRFREIIPKSKYEPQTNEMIPSGLKVFQQHNSIRGETPGPPGQKTCLTTSR